MNTLDNQHGCWAGGHNPFGIAGGSRGIVGNAQSQRRGCPAVRRGQWLNARLVSYRFGRPGPPAWLSSGINLCGMRWAAKIGLAVCALLLVPPAGG